MTAGIRSIADIRERNTRRAMLERARRAAVACLRGAMIALPVAIGLAGTLAVAPTVTTPNVELLALVGVSIWTMVALFLTAVLAARSR